MKAFEFAIFIARCQPVHNAHLTLIREALGQAQTAIVVLGSYNKAPDIRNPWTAEQRETMMRAALTVEENLRVKCIYMRDYLYNDLLWVTELTEHVEEIANGSNSIVLIGHEHSSDEYYLHLFPQWKFMPMKNIDRCPHATKIRTQYFTHDAAYKEHVHPKTAAYLEDFKKTDAFKRLKEEYDFVNKYTSAWDGAPFKPTFVTLDSIVIKSAHVLVVRRGGNPGRGLIALPGGFLSQSETLVDGAIRELKEETSIALSKEELKKTIVDQRVFDHPLRSLRGRTITHAFMFNLGSGSLPKVKGADDSAKSWWMPLRDFRTREESFYEDHHQIISYFVNKF